MPKPHIPMKGIRLLSPSRQGKLRRHLIMAITSFHTLKYKQQKLAIETSRPHQIFVNIFECDQPNLPTNINAWIYVDHLASQFRKKIPADIQLYKHPSRLPLLSTVDERETNRVCPIRFIPQVQVAQHHLRRKLRGYDVTNIPFKNNKLPFLLRFEGQSM